MIFENDAELRDRIESCTNRRIRREIPVVGDTTNYMKIEAGCLLRVEGNDYYITGEATEGRFGIGDQPKFWVKYAWDLSDRTRKIIKLVFHEEFTARLGLFTVRCVRDPDKESSVLELVRGDGRFMQGRTVWDSVGNNVRVIEHIKGRSLYNHINNIEQSHEEYFHSALPTILERVLGCFDALSYLEHNGFQHGDVRNDHILIESSTSEYRWIDFDYEVNYQDFDVWSAGNILTYVVGKGICTCAEGATIQKRSKLGNAPVCEEDALVFFKHRMANLRKIYPYVPPSLNDILMRFSMSTHNFYEDMDEITTDLRAALKDMPAAPGGD